MGHNNHSRGVGVKMASYALVTTGWPHTMLVRYDTGAGMRASHYGNSW